MCCTPNLKCMATALIYGLGQLTLQKMQMVEKQTKKFEDSFMSIKMHSQRWNKCFFAFVDTLDSTWQKMVLSYSCNKLNLHKKDAKKYLFM